MQAGNWGGASNRKADTQRDHHATTGMQAHIRKKKTCHIRAISRKANVPKFWTHQSKFQLFCDRTVREKAWRSRKRVA